MDSAQSGFTPEVIKDRIGISYRFTFPSSGLFQCSLTGLIFNVTHEGEVMYKTLIWDKMLLQPANKVPGGLLFSIKCSQDSISQLHLPHCEPEPALVSKSLSVVHITDDGMSFIQPREITKTHVVVDTPHLTAFGIVWDLIERFKNFITKPVSGQVLLFLRPPCRGGTLILSVIVLPGNVPLKEVKVQHEECEYIKAPSHCLLHKGQNYSLFSDPDVYTIQPSHATFFDNYGPNYHATFEIFMTTSTEEVTLMVQDPNRTQVWEYNLHLRDENQPKKNISTSAQEKL
ncbi:NACHT, LRR and PYD domains-containing protein 1-like isoform X2 [Pagrus major]|uniref:NACHT, LRR and PYD domains-containing protein 1-like isoform X2 n=1 Tax=Pagrus major TaxID=143350 RepID=UPI003CC851FB